MARKGLLLHPLCKVQGSDPYNYSFYPHQNLNDFNMEQQGDIIADYFAFFHLRSVRAKGIVSDSGFSYRNYQSSYLEVLSDFIRASKKC